MKLAILLVVGVIARQAYGDEPEAIVGGDATGIGQFPHQASLQILQQHFCGGSIIDETHILTAGHCVENPNEHPYIEVVTGSLWSVNGRGDRHKIKCVRVHPDYTGKSSDGWKNDIAVITLTKPIEFNRFQKPIALASRDYADGKQRGKISGWGQTSVNSDTSPYLRWVEVNALSRADCLAAHPNRGNGNPFTNSKHICTLESRGKGACSGDSGGPLVINDELCGVTSWVALCALGIADVFTNVFYYLDFIQQSIAMC